MTGCIKYCLISRGEEILCQASSGGNINKDVELGTGMRQIVSVLLQRILKSNSRKSYIHEGHSYNYIVSNELIWLCVADVEFSTRICFAFLDKIMSLWDGNNFNNFQQIIIREIVTYSTNPNVDKINTIQSDINKVKDVMIENIEQVLKRGEKIDEVLSKTDQMRDAAQTFRIGSRKVKWAMWSKNVKLIVILIAVIAAIIFVIILAACDGFISTKCRPSSTSATSTATISHGQVSISLITMSSLAILLMT